MNAWWSEVQSKHSKFANIEIFSLRQAFSTCINLEWSLKSKISQIELKNRMEIRVGFEVIPKM